jgi:hypothetical protein
MFGDCDVATIHHALKCAGNLYSSGIEEWQEYQECLLKGRAYAKLCDIDRGPVALSRVEQIKYDLAKIVRQVDRLKENLERLT